MYSIKINYGLPNDRQVFITPEEVKKAYSSKKEFNKLIEKIKKESRKDGQNN